MKYLKLRKITNTVLDISDLEYTELQDDEYSKEVDSLIFENRIGLTLTRYRWSTSKNRITDNFGDQIKYEEVRSISNLLIYQYMADTDLSHRDFDFTTILFKDEAIIHKGQKRIQHYRSDDNKLVVSKHYDYITGDRSIYGSVISGRLLALKVRIEWYGYNGEVADYKEVIVKRFNRQEEGEILLKRRDRQIAALRSLADGTAAAPVVDAIYSHYDDVIYDYIHRGSSMFSDTIYSEDDPTILMYLSIKIPQIFMNLDMSDAIFDGDNWIIKIKQDFTNCMLYHYTEENTELPIWSYDNHRYDISNEKKCTYIGATDGFYEFKINALPNFNWLDTHVYIKFTSTIRDYILHEVEKHN